MKDYIFLEWSKFNDYHSISDSSTSSKLYFLVNFFLSNYDINDISIFKNVLSFYDTNFIYNDYDNKIFYIGIFNKSFDKIVKTPSLEQFFYYVNEANSCKISHDNFIDLVGKLKRIKANPAPFAIIYSVDNWISLKDFRFKEDMELFDQNVLQQFPIMYKKINEIFLYIKLCVDIKQSDSYFNELEKIQSFLCQLMFVEDIRTPEYFNNFVKDFDNMGDPWWRNYIFNKIKTENYSLDGKSAMDERFERVD